ncbi:MAG: hypothetical protein HZB71_13655 [Betaproteobacteria bacterium]|nr:hypothetical protein [Betaproteobacteria bacterium]
MSNIDRRKLKQTKSAEKRLVEISFKPARSRRLPKPFDRLGARAYLSDMIELGGEFRAVFVWRDGETVSRSSFYGHLLQSTDAGLLPLAILHYHPSHKGLHAVLNCEIERNYVGRQLPGAPEFSLKGADGLDPRSEADRKRLVCLFCERFGVMLGQDGGLFHAT